MSLAAILLGWFDVHGRRHLPTYQENDPYAIWVGEVLLQQTQLSRGLAYRQRFLATFPDLATLAQASEDAVQAVCAGIGYYGRIHRLHQAARQLRAQGGLPRDFAGWLEVPGVGRTTAAAIAVQAHGERQVVLDGNIQRLMARFHALDEPSHSAKGRAALWRLAEAHLPAVRLRDYTQALMDFGATWCLPRAPRCADCPLQAHCAARLRGAVAAYPVRIGKQPRKEQTMRLLLVYNEAGAVWLEPRPEPGIWAGLWSLPGQEHAQGQLAQELNDAPPRWQLRHLLTHRMLHIEVRVLHHRMRDASHPARWPGSTQGRWCDPTQLEVGVPAPIARILACWQEEPYAHGPLHQAEQGGPGVGQAAHGRTAGSENL